MSRCIGLIPARSGSKGLPGKNIVDLCGRPLLAYSIDAARESGVIEEVYVSSDDTEILSVAEEFGARCFQRAIELAQDSTPTDLVIEEFILKTGLKAEDIIVLLQPTSPLRKSGHIIRSIEQFKKTKACRALISVVEVENKYLYGSVVIDGVLKSISEEYSKIPRRQDLPKLVLPNGAIYIFTVKEFMVDRCIPAENVIPFVMDEQSSIDIDTIDDLRIAKNSLDNSTLAKLEI